MVDTNNTSENQNNDQQNNDQQNNNQQNNSSGCIYDKYGRSPDKKTICGIGLKSASADTGEGLQKCVFETSSLAPSHVPTKQTHHSS